MATTNTCTITLDVTGFGYTHLLQLLDMTDTFLEDGDNAAAAEALRDWIENEAVRFLEEARANHDYPAADFFEAFIEEETEEETEEEAEEEAANKHDAAADAIAIWFEDDRQEEETQLRNEAENVKADPYNLFKAGTFEGMARMLAATITGYGADRGASINELKMAIYDRYGVAW